VADSAVSILDSAGVARAVDAQTVGTDFQQTVNIGDGATAGRVAKVTSTGDLQTISNLSGTVTQTSVTSVITSVTILAANAARRGAIIYNDSTSVLRLSYGTTAASTTAFSVLVQANSAYFLDVPLWTGAITGIWVTANGAARVTDLSA
jgi:hypothetical protein